MRVPHFAGAFFHKVNVSTMSFFPFSQARFREVTTRLNASLTAGMSASSSHKLSFPALISRLRQQLPPEKHADLEAVSHIFHTKPAERSEVRLRNKNCN